MIIIIIGRYSTNLTELVGPSKDLLESELPTLGDILRYGIYLRESHTNPRYYSVKIMAKDIYQKLKYLWEKANPLFKNPVIWSEKTIVDKICLMWERMTDISNKRITKSSAIEQFKSSLNKIFDILKCKCSITSCSEFGCGGCSISVHTKCICAKEMKIPILELAFIKAQREKVGSLSKLQMGPVDYIETKKQKKSEKRKLEDDSCIKVNKKTILEKQVPNISNDEVSSSSTSSGEEYHSRYDKHTTRNTRNIDNIAKASIRYGVSTRATAAIATAAWIDAGIITTDQQDLVIDHNRLQRAKDRLQKKETSAEIDDNIQCIFFDGRKDLTKMIMHDDVSFKNYPRKFFEEHYSICSEPGGEYITHFTPDSSNDDLKPAEIIANHIVEWVKTHGVDESLIAIGGDSTNTNTGWKGGIIQFIEKKLEKKLMWIICALHTNELPLRHLIIDLDGKTLSGNHMGKDGIRIFEEGKARRKCVLKRV